MAADDFVDSASFDAGSPEPAPLSRGQRKWNNLLALGKNKETSRVIVITGVLLVVGVAFAFVAYRSLNRQQEVPIPADLQGVRMAPAPDGLAVGRNDALANSREYQGMVAKVGEARASEAVATGGTSQPLAATVEFDLKPSLTPEDAERVRQEEVRKMQEQKLADAAAGAAAAAAAAAAGGQSGLQDAAGGESATMGQPGQEPERIRQARAVIEKLIARSPSGPDSLNLRSPTVAQGNNSPAAGRVPPADAAVASSAASAPGASPRRTLHERGYIGAARIDTAINTARGKHFRATLLTGPYKGAWLTGTYARNGEVADSRVTAVSLPGRGISMPADAVLLDATSMEEGIASEVDRKLLIKYGVKPLAAGVAAISEYLKNSGTTVVVNGQSVVTTQPELTGRRAAQIIGGAAAQQMNSDANALDTTPVVRGNVNDVVAVFFLSDLIYTPNQGQ